MTTEVDEKNTAMKDVQNEAGLPAKADKKSEELYKFTSDAWFFEYAMTAWKNKETGEYDEAKPSLTLAGPKNYATQKRTYMRLPLNKQAFEEFVAHVMPVWRDACTDTKTNAPRIVDNLPKKKS